MTDEKQIPVHREADYRTAEGISYSALSRLSKGPRAYIDKEKPEGDFLDNGSAVDIMLTEGEEAFHEQFYIMTATKPAVDQMRIYTETMIETDDHAQALAASGYKRAVSMDKWEEVGKPYYDAVRAAGDKTVLDFDQNTKIMATVNQLKTNEFTRNYFEKDLPAHIEIKYQFIHYWDQVYVNPNNGQSLKRRAKLKADILIIDHSRKKIFGKDLKTAGKPTSAWLTSYRTYHYYLQEGLYQEGICYWAEEYYPEYTVEPFEFIVAQMGAYSMPLIFSVSKEQHQLNFNGGKTSSGYKVKGVNQLLCDLDYYEELNQWDYKQETMENNGRVDIDLLT